jgi:hypothetical protein
MEIGRNLAIIITLIIAVLVACYAFYYTHDLWCFGGLIFITLILDYFKDCEKEKKEDKQ